MEVFRPMQTLPLATRNVFSSCDIGEVRSHLCTALRPHDVWLTNRDRPLSFSHNQAKLGQVTLNALYYGSEVSIRAPETEDAYIVKLTLAGSGRVWQGGDAQDFKTNSIYVFNPTRPMTCQLSSDNRQLTLRMSRDVINQFLRDELSCNLKDPVEFTDTPFDLCTDVPGLKAFLEGMCADLSAPVSGFGRRQVSHQAEQLLLTLLLTHMPHNYSEIYERASFSPAPHYIRRAEDYIRAHVREDISLQDMAIAAGTSIRSLQNGFRKYRSSSPMEYLRNYRLDLARKGLSECWRSGRTVTDVAIDLGFTHLSKFSKCYRERFGEMPSQTLLYGKAN
jgi:AraC-like DNA-binding protein